MRHSSSLQGKSKLFLALTWPKQLSCNPKLGYSSSHKHTMDDSSNPQFPKQGKLSQRIGNQQWPKTKFSTTTNKTWGRQQPQMKGESQLKPTRKLRVVLGPNVAKTTQQPHQTRVMTAAQFHNKNSGNNPQPTVDKKQNS